MRDDFPNERCTFMLPNKGIARPCVGINEVRRPDEALGSFSRATSTSSCRSGVVEKLSEEDAVERIAEIELGACKPGVQLSSGDSAKGAEKSEKGNSEREGLTPWSSQNGVKCSRSTTHVLMGRICHHKNKGYVKVKPSNVHASWRECCRFPSAC
jgi:hypothetical protein